MKQVIVAAAAIGQTAWNWYQKTRAGTATARISMSTPRIQGEHTAHARANSLAPGIWRRRQLYWPRKTIRPSVTSAGQIPGVYA